MSRPDQILRFRVKWDFRKSTAWSTDLARVFGAQNEGIVIEADDIEGAGAIMEHDHRMNRFYLSFEAVL